MSEDKTSIAEEVLNLNKMFCPCCFQELPVALQQPTEAQKEAFLMSMLGGAPYSRTFELMGGNIIVRVSDKTPEEGALLTLVLESLMTLNREHPETASQAFPISGMFSLISMIKYVKVTAHGECKAFDNSQGTELLKKMAAPLLKTTGAQDKCTVADVEKVYKDMNEYLDSVVTVPRVLLNSCVSQFIHLRDNLIGACYSADFYKGAGL